MKERVEQLEAIDIVRIAGGVVLGLAVWNLLDALAHDVVGPLIAVFVGNSIFQLNAFTIEHSEFPYGHFLEVLFAAVGAVLVLAVVFPALWEQIRGTRTDRDDV